MLRLPLLSALTSLFSVIALHAAPALGAPQALGVIATAEPAPMTCRESVCRVRLSTFCLEQHRQIPYPGYPYEAAGEGMLRLVAVAGNGAVRDLPSGRLSIRAAGLYTSVEVSVEISELSLRENERPAIAVAPLATLLPEQKAGDPAPHSAADLALTTGPLRQAAASYFDHSSPPREAAIALARAITTGVDQLESREAALGRLSRVAGESLAARGAGPEAEALVRKAFRRCGAHIFSLPGYGTVEGCLQSDHDRLLQPINKRFWAGSGGV